MSSKILDSTLEFWAGRVVRDARKNARGTQMSKEFKVRRVSNGRIDFVLPEYGMYQNTGVRGTDSSSGAVRAAQRRAKKLGLVDREFRYKQKQPPSDAWARYSSDPSVRFAISVSVRRNGFPFEQTRNLNWLNKAFQKANDEFDTTVADQLGDDLTNLIYGEE